MSEETGATGAEDNGGSGEAEGKPTPVQRVMAARAAFDALPRREKLKLVARYGAGAVGALALAVCGGRRHSSYSPLIQRRGAGAQAVADRPSSAHPARRIHLSFASMFYKHADESKRTKSKKREPGWGLSFRHLQLYSASCIASGRMCRGRAKLRRKVIPISTPS